MLNSAKDIPLDQMQRWFQAVVTHPEGVRRGVETETARWLGGDAVEIERILTRSNGMDAFDRLSVYGNAYYARLMDCLREEYPVVRKFIGDDTFDAFASGYLQAYPPQSYTLFELGRKFPTFLQDTRPVLEIDSSQPEWPDFLIELAELEKTFSEVFDGPGPERSPTLDARMLSAIDPDQLLSIRLIPVPCLRLLRFRFPVHKVFGVIRRGEEPFFPDPQDTWLAVSRSKYVVHYYELSKGSFALLDCLIRGQQLGEALQTVIGEEETNEGLEVQLQSWFHDWTSRGFFLEFNMG